MSIIQDSLFHFNIDENSDRLPYSIIPTCSHDHKGMPPWHESACGYLGKGSLARFETRKKTTKQEVEKWSKKWTASNAALVLGGRTGLVSFDADGRIGEIAYQFLFNNYPPTTWRILTHKGSQYVFSIPIGANVPTTAIYRLANRGELFFVSDGIYITIPPSIHKEGTVYKWANGLSPIEFGPPTPLPPEILESLATGVMQEIGNKAYKQYIKELTDAEK